MLYKIFDSKKTMLLAIIILLSGIFLRFYKLKEVYTEYDDIGVLSLYKTPLPYGQPPKEPQILLSNKIFTVQYKPHSKNQRKYLLDTIYYPLHIGRSWTYAVGQYLFYPLLIKESDPYYTKIFKARFISAVFGSLGLLLFTWLLYLLSDNKINTYSLLPLCIVAFSFNSVIYAHHMGPYVTMATTFIAALILFDYTLVKKISVTIFLISLAILTIFNYLIILTIPVFLLLIFLKFKTYDIKSIFKTFFWGVVSYLFIFSPIYFLFFKADKGLRGLTPPPLKNGIIAYLTHFIKQFFKSFASVFAIFTTYDYINISLVSIIFILALAIFILLFHRLDFRKYIFLFAFVFLLEWIVLHAMHKLVLDQSRHLLIWTVLIALLLFLIIKVSKFKPDLLYATTILIIILGFITNYKLINNRLSEFDFEAINQQNIKNILTYSHGEFQLVLYYGNKKKIITFSNAKSLKKYLSNTKRPKNLLLISQGIPIWDFLGIKHRKKVKISKYKLEVIKETLNQNYLTYNNKPVCVEPNGFYLYKLKK